jgi:hypothetical protein
MVTLLLLNSGEYLISQTEQLEYEPRCHLQRPYQVTGMSPFELETWPKYTDEEDILLHTEAIKTICEPTASLLEQYLQKIGKTLEEIESQERRLLTEEDLEELAEGDYPLDENGEVMYKDVMYIEE